MEIPIPVKSMEKTTWLKQTVKASGVKPAVSLLGKLEIKVEQHCICSTAYVLIQQDAGLSFINNIISFNVLKAEQLLNPP